MREMVLQEDDETLETRLEDKNQQLKKWMNRWQPVIDHSIKKVEGTIKGEQ